MEKIYMEENKNKNKKVVDGSVTFHPDSSAWPLI